MFNPQQFCHIASNNRNDVKSGVFVYKTTDDLDTILSANYFVDMSTELNVNDIIIHVHQSAIDGEPATYNMLVVSGKTFENVVVEIADSDYLSGKFVLKAGDTMTGQLIINYSDGIDGQLVLQGADNAFTTIRSLKSNGSPTTVIYNQSSKTSGVNGAIALGMAEFSDERGSGRQVAFYPWSVNLSLGVAGQPWENVVTKCLTVQPDASGSTTTLKGQILKIFKPGDTSTAFGFNMTVYGDNYISFSPAKDSLYYNLTGLSGLIFRNDYAIVGIAGYPKGSIAELWTRYIGNPSSTKFKGLIIVPQVPTGKTETFALLSDVDRAATSGVIKGAYWFGKTQASTTVPAPTIAGQNYIDFTTLKTYVSNDGTSWTENGTFTIPDGIDFSIMITSKFWDIPEQTNQQGGRAVYMHTSSSWAYYPQIISQEYVDAQISALRTELQNYVTTQLGNYVSSTLVKTLTKVNSLPSSPDTNTMYAIPE